VLNKPPPLTSNDHFTSPLLRFKRQDIFIFKECSTINLSPYCINIADHRGREVSAEFCLLNWDRHFESHARHGCKLYPHNLCLVRVVVCRQICYEPILHKEILLNAYQTKYINTENVQPCTELIHGTTHRQQICRQHLILFLEYRPINENRRGQSRALKCKSRLGLLHKTVVSALS